MPDDDPLRRAHQRAATRSEHLTRRLLTGPTDQPTEPDQPTQPADSSD